MTDNELIHWVLLAHTMGIGPTIFQRLLQHYPNISNLFSESSNNLKQQGLSDLIIEQIRKPNWALAEAVLKWKTQPNHFVLTLNDPNYPIQLKNIPTAPPILYVQGQLQVIQHPQIAIVGSRNPTLQGSENAFYFACELTKVGLVITSGLATGIDMQSHQGALKINGLTVGVLGTGINIIYPRKHRLLAKKISEQGALISEFPLDTPPRALNFPRRNRIISGLSLGVLVVEAALKSGSLITARFALEQNREVFAVPGSIHNPLTKGCHWLLRQGAKLVQSADDILEEISRYVPNIANTLTLSTQVNTPQLSSLAGEYQELLKCLTFEASSIDIIIKRSQLPAFKVNAMLLELEMSGFITCTQYGYALVTPGKKTE